ncbi:hypothetical protein OS493_027619 [Desmophyllum pertusum]|uniref:Uncharacterized protein n=1 Tax=Desmophyllum pertusum TaxID=174260 RepID=A0A9X0D2M1_9CNID|nr:hypothetical protein OS493_027619 [Desmophyllum pertusum]
MDDDGVYGELIMSKLNEALNNTPDDARFDSYGEDWYGFAEEYRRERRPFLYTIPEDEEIGLADVNKERESYLWGQPRVNYNYDNEFELNVTKETELKAPIAAMEASDSEYDLDDNEDLSSSETETECNGEIDAEANDQDEKPDEPALSDKIITYNGVTVNGVTRIRSLSDELVTNNGVTEIGGIRDEKDSSDDEEKWLEEPALSDKIITNNSVTKSLEIEGVTDTANVEQKWSRNGVTTNDGNTVAVDHTRSVTIVKKIKIFVRKEVKVAKDDQEFLLSPKQLIEDSCKKDKTDTRDESNATWPTKEVEEEEIILECREGKNHPAYDEIKAEIGPINHFTQPLNFEEEQCNISEVDAMKIEMKREYYTPRKPEPKIVDEIIKERVPTVEASQFFAEPPTQKDHTESVERESKIMVETMVWSRVEADVPVHDITQYFAEPPAEKETKITAKPESIIVDEIIEKRVPTVEASQFFAEPPTQKDQTVVETIVARVSRVEVDAPVRDITQHLTQPPLQKDQTKINATSKSKIVHETVETRTSPAGREAPGRDITQHSAKLPIQNDQTIINATPESKIVTIKGRASPVESHIPERNNTQPQSKIVSETSKSRVSPVDAHIPERDITRTQKPESKIAPETTKARASAVQTNVPKRDVKQNYVQRLKQKYLTKISDNLESNITSEAIKPRASSVDSVAPNVTSRNDRHEAIKRKSVLISSQK